MGKRDREESPKGKSPSKTADARNSKGSKEASKAKHFYIVVVAEGAPRENLPSKRTMKRKITVMFVIHKKDVGTSENTLYQPMFCLRDA